MKLITKNISLLAIAMIVVLAFTQCMNDQKKLEAAAKLFNKTAPIEVAGIVRLDKMEALPEKKIKMYVTMYDENGMLRTLDPKMMSISMGAQMKKMIATSPEMKTFRDMSATFIFAITTDTGNAFDDIVITPEDYNNPEAAKPVDNDDIAAGLQLSVDAMKGSLPFTDPNTGITITDVYVEGSNTMVSVQELPDEMAQGDKESFVASAKQNLKEYFKANPAFKSFLGKGVIVKYIYNTTGGDTYAEIIFTKDDL